MNDNFTQALWELGEDSPEARRAIAQAVNAEAGYSIPTRRYSEVLEETGDIHYYYLDIAQNEEHRDALAKAIKKVDSITVGELARQLNNVRVAMLVKEVEEGKELTPVEKTLRDIDVTMLALTAIMEAPKVIGRTRPLRPKKEDPEG